MGLREKTIPRMSPSERAPSPVQFITATGPKVGGSVVSEVGGNGVNAGRSFSERSAESDGRVVLNARPPAARNLFSRYERYLGTSMHN